MFINFNAVGLDYLCCQMGSLKLIYFQPISTLRNTRVTNEGVRFTRRKKSSWALHSHSKYVKRWMAKKRFLDEHLSPESCLRSRYWVNRKKRGSEETGDSQERCGYKDNLSLISKYKISYLMTEFELKPYSLYDIEYELTQKFFENNCGLTVKLTLMRPF